MFNNISDRDGNKIRDLLIAAGIRAPSGDNCQPWFFRAENDNKLKIEFLPKRAKSFFDFQNHGTLLSIGAVIENIRVQAAEHGLGIKVLYPERISADSTVASICWQNSDFVKYPEGQTLAMLNRTVNRRPFIPFRLPEEKLAQVLGEPIEATVVQVFQNRDEISKWARIIYIADLIRFSHPVIHQEVFSKILFSKSEAEEKRIGLEIDRLGLGPGAGPIIRHIKPWKNMERLSKFGVARLLAGQSRLLSMATSALLLVKISSNDRDNWVKAGEQVQRLWINAAREGLQVHPMTVSLYLDHRFQAESIKNFLPHHEPLLMENRRLLDEILRGGVGTMIFRLGRGIPMKNTAIRLPFHTFLSSR